MYGCGITPEVDLAGGHTFRPPSLSRECERNGIQEEVDELRRGETKVFVALMKTVSEKHKGRSEHSVEKSREEFESIAGDEGTELT